MSQEQFLAVCNDSFRDLYEPPEPATVATMRGPAWIRSAVNRALRWLDAKAPPALNRVKVRRFNAPSGPFLDRLRLQQRDMDRIYNQKARVLFIGPDSWPEAEREVLMASRVMHFPDAEMRLGGGNGIRVFGVEIVFVPWMTGVLLVPEWRDSALRGPERDAREGGT